MRAGSARSVILRSDQLTQAAPSSALEKRQYVSLALGVLY
jgi:hypothetical protein